MQSNTNNYETYQLDDTEIFWRETLIRQVMGAFNQGDITEDMKMHLLTKPQDTADELKECFDELEAAIRNKQYYQLIARIEKAEVVIEREPDMRKKQFYVKKMKELAEQLERLRPIA